MINHECIRSYLASSYLVTEQGDIPAKVIKDDKDLFPYFVFASFKNAVNKGVFPDGLYHADIKPIYKKESRNEKENYRPISIFPNLSKIFERCMHDQLKDYFNKILSKYQCGIRKGFSTRHCLLAMIEKLRKSDTRGASAVLLADLKRLIVCPMTYYDLSIAKLHAYGIKKGSLNLLFSFIKNRK